MSDAHAHRRKPRPLIAQCRRAYFAMCKAFGLDESGRHAFNLDNVGIESTRDPAWGLPQWLMAVSLLQIASGREGVVAGRPHIKGLRPDAQAEADDPWPLDGAATPSQCRYIRNLALARMRDRESVMQIIRIRAFPHGQETLADQWQGSLETLPRTVAARAILILRRLHKPAGGASPVGGASVVGGGSAPRVTAGVPF